MCGICGIYNFDSTKVTSREIDLMNNEMYQRGPDDVGSYINSNYGIGMRRLSIIDIQRGKQPMFSEDGNIILVFNGEIFNYIELKKNLSEKNYNFTTNSDTEVVIKAYQEYGEEFLKKLNGMFSICIIDKKKGLILIARDRFGIKPLYYFLSKKKIIFASNLKSIKKQLTSCTISSKDFLLYLSTNYVPASNSIFKNIFKLKPAHYIKIKNNKIQYINYWNLALTKKYKDPKIFNEVLKNLIIDSVKIQSRSDVDVATMLSGGLDSSIISTIFADYNKNIKSFCIDFHGKNNNENIDAELISKQIKSEHFYKKINHEDFYSTLKEIAPSLDEPIADNALIPSYIISKMAKKQNIKVILSGAGGDELFGGYARHYHNFRNFFCGILKLNNNLSLKISKILPKKIKNYFLKINSKSIAYINSTSGINISILLQILKNKQIETELIHNIEKIFSPFLNQGNSYKETIMRTDLLNYLPEDILSLLDKTTMINSIEGRVPFLDHRIAEHIFSNNSEIFSEKNFINSKNVLKNLFSSKLPSKILYKKKVGFNAPLNNWSSQNYNFFSENFSKNSFYENFFKKDFHQNSLLEKKESSGLVFAFNVFDQWFKYND